MCDEGQMVGLEGRRPVIYHIELTCTKITLLQHCTDS